MSAVVLFVRLDDWAFDVGMPGIEAVFEPRANGRVGAAMVHALAVSRGRRVDLTELLPPGDREKPRACAWNAIQRAIAQIDNTSPMLAAALRSFETWTDPEERGRVFGRLQARVTGVRIETQTRDFAVTSP